MSPMREVSVHYHWEPKGWWADSPDLPGLSAAGATFTEVRSLAVEGIDFAVEEPVVVIEEGVIGHPASDTPIEVRQTPMGV